MPEVSAINLVITGLAFSNLIIRLGGYYLGAALPQGGPWARGLKALPGTLISALVTLQLIGGGPLEWMAGAIALAVALTTRSLPLTMAAAVLGLWLMRSNGLL